MDNKPVIKTEPKKRGRKANTNSNESPSDRFKRLATERTKKVMKDIASIKKLSKGKQYESNMEAVNKIENTLREEVNTISDSFKKVESSKIDDFTL